MKDTYQNKLALLRIKLHAKETSDNFPLDAYSKGKVNNINHHIDVMEKKINETPEYLFKLDTMQKSINEQIQIIDDEIDGLEMQELAL